MINPPLQAFLGAALESMPLIAVLRWITPDEVESVGEILIGADFKLIEVPLNSPDPYESIRRLSRSFGSEALIGAGTVMDPADVARVQDAGGRLIVMPHSDLEVVRAAHEAGLACFPGVATPTEGFASLAAGAAGLKLFPAENIPPAALKAWRAVFAQEIPLLPTGGVEPEMMADYVEAGASGFGIGGKLYAPGRALSQVHERAHAYAAAWRATQAG